MSVPRVPPHLNQPPIDTASLTTQPMNPENPHDFIELIPAPTDPNPLQGRVKSDAPQSYLEGLPLLLFEMYSKLRGPIGQAADRAFEAFNQSTQENDYLSSENIKTLNQVLLILGIGYNFWCSRFVFTISTVIGVLSSSKLLPESLHFKSLETQLLDPTPPKETNTIPVGTCQKIQFLLGALNMYLGRNFFEDMALGMTSGLITGNTIFFMAQPEFQKKIAEAGNSVISKKITETWKMVSGSIFFPVVP